MLIKNTTAAPPANNPEVEIGIEVEVEPDIFEPPALEPSDSTINMSSKSKSGQSSGSGGFHQEYIASLRYRNDLPPPDLPPKFLDIPHEGLGRFITPGFASNLARREEPNIDVDAEGGMPIDLVGIPGLHLGDESGIYPFLFWLVQDTRLTFLRSYHGSRAPAAHGPG